MNRALLRSVVLCASCLGVTTLAMALKPVDHAQALSALDLERMVPAEFDGWHVEHVQQTADFSADVQAEINKIYSEVLDRTYVNGSGQRVMLSIAYGGDQESGSQLHRPEFCYEAQGFKVEDVRDGSLALGATVIPVRRMIATRDARVEPVTYWITVGDKVVLPGLRRKLAQLSYGLSGRVPDGMLVRVSTLGGDAHEAWSVQADFMRAMSDALSGPARLRITGRADA